MFQKKPIYVIGIVVFTLILMADLMLYFFSPMGFDRGDFSSGKPGGGFASGNSGFESLEGTDGDESSGFGSIRPGGDNGDFTMPEGMEKPMDKELPEGMELPEGFASALKPGKGQMGGAMSIFTTIRNLFWPVLIVCIIGNGLCSFMLIRISRKKKAALLKTRVISETPVDQLLTMSADT